jgi:hypothetical protein
MRYKIFAILILLCFFIVWFLFFTYNHKKRISCGNGICEISENSLNCCIDCGCYKDNEVCIDNKCVAKEITLSNDEFVNIIKEYFSLRNEKIEEIGEIYNISLKTILAKTTIIRTNKSTYGVTVAENRTLFLYECCAPGSKLLDIWRKS